MDKKRNQSKSQIRNLAQYKDLTEEEFEELYDESISLGQYGRDFEERIEKKIEEFSQDYDIDDLKINDKETLRALIQAIIALEDYEQIVFEMRSSEKGIGQSTITIVDRLSKVMSDLRKDISNFQTDLNITRKIRKSDKEATVINYLDSLKEKARQFYESKMSYIFCPECNMLLGTIWTLYPNSDNKLTFVCRRKMDDGTLCSNKFTVTTRELLENNGTNKPKITPESLIA